MSFLRSLSDKQILSKISELVRRERSLTRAVLLHLNEIERRRLHLKLGHASMFDYCTAGLGYSSSAAARRIRTARCIARYPEVLVMLESNQANLSTVSLVSRVLSPENKETLLPRIRGKSQREVEAIVAEHEPRSLPRERVRAIVVQAPMVPTRPGAGRGAATLSAAETFGAATALPLPTPSANRDRKCEELNDLEPGHCRCGSESGQRPVETRVLLSFSASEAFMSKLETIRAIAWHRLPANASMEQVFELVMDHFIEKEDPRARHARREKRAAAVKNSTAETDVNFPKNVDTEKDGDTANCGNATHGGRMSKRGSTTGTTRRRHIAAEVRDQIFARDQGRCTFIGAAGKRCSATRAVQIDHIEPFARGGDSTRENLRLLCADHNRFEADRILGVRTPAPVA